MAKSSLVMGTGMRVREDRFIIWVPEGRSLWGLGGSSDRAGAEAWTPRS